MELINSLPEHIGYRWCSEHLPAGGDYCPLCRIAELELFIRQEMTFISSRLQGSTHWVGCEDEHPLCAAYKRMEQALRGEGEDGY